MVNRLQNPSTICADIKQDSLNCLAILLVVVLCALSTLGATHCLGCPWLATANNTMLPGWVGLKEDT